MPHEAGGAAAQHRLGACSSRCTGQYATVISTHAMHRKALHPPGIQDQRPGEDEERQMAVGLLGKATGWVGEERVERRQPSVLPLVEWQLGSLRLGVL